MIRFFFVIFLFLMMLMPQVSWSATTSQYPNPYRQTMWNNITDGVHTFGQNAQQKKATLRKLHNARTNVRLHKISQANLAKLKAKRQAWLNTQNNVNP